MSDEILKIKSALAAADKKKKFLELASIIMQWLKRAIKEIQKENEILKNKGTEK